MKTTNEFIDYCQENDTGSGFNAKQLTKHFSLIEKNLMKDEEGLVAFIGLKDFVSATKHDNNYAYLITNKRIIMGQKKLVGENVVTVSLKNLNDISLNVGMVFATVTFDTIKETFGVGIAKAKGQNIFSLAHEALNL